MKFSSMAENVDEFIFTEMEPKNPSQTFVGVIPCCLTYTFVFQEQAEEQEEEETLQIPKPDFLKSQRTNEWQKNRGG